ncbi:Ser/Thr protein phosphatase family protein [Fulvivirga imtechensis AK7]|uniref:Ser/Thr protein phosphatase family protein n=1 Tax=Fulvivirga imtechensis AK7 TaxID=1237149 RepID=L8JW74_9BACT|nr:UDP-2,3-diacylglucosamine diphosphatase [Fulvivirga imtechensis]ELR71482.1 Ser/Thr protein phosphatase family protein [Fulvivirga imtechensis AK7]
MKEYKRPVDVVVISDVHLGTYGCHAEDLLRYLKTIRPKKIILNGDIIDIWQFSKRYWPNAHMQIIKYITSMLSKGTEVVYITGNHDEMLRKFVGFKLGGFSIENKIVLELDGKKAWIFHGDVFDVTMQYSKWLARLGAIGYDTLILVNTFANFILKTLGRGKISLSKRIKDSVKSAVKFINDFETTAADIAISNGYDYVLCGHIHHPDIRTIRTEKGEVVYLNSGDWVENLTALEYSNKEWNIYNFSTDMVAKTVKLSKRGKASLNNEDIFKDMINEFLMVK